LRRTRDSSFRNVYSIEINDLISSNRRVKLEYDELTEGIFQSIKKQIYFPAPTNFN